MDSFNFRVTYTMPTLDEIIECNSCLIDCGPYNRYNFIQFLHNFHCAENFDFVIEVDALIAGITDLDNQTLIDDDTIRTQDSLSRLWKRLHATFISPTSEKEVNIPHFLRAELRENQLPTIQQLNKGRQIVYDILLDSFHEFIAFTREHQNGGVCRRQLESIPPELPRSVRFETHLVSNPMKRRIVTDSEYHKELSEDWERALEETEARLHGSISSRTESESSPTTEYSQSVSVSNFASRASSRTSSRGSSISFLVDNIKDYSGWNKTRKIIQRRRSSQESSVNF